MPLTIHIPNHFHQVALVAGLAYTIAPEVSGNSGTVSYFLKGTLPDGLSFNGATGVISGTPTTVSDNSTAFGIPQKPVQIMAVCGSEVANSETFWFLIQCSFVIGYNSTSSINGNQIGGDVKNINLTVGDYATGYNLSWGFNHVQTSEGTIGVTGVITGGYPYGGSGALPVVSIIGNLPPGIHANISMWVINFDGIVQLSGFNNSYTFHFRFDFPNGVHVLSDPITFTVNSKVYHDSIPAYITTGTSFSWSPNIVGLPANGTWNNLISTLSGLTMANGVISGSISSSNVPATGNRYAIANINLQYSFEDNGTTRYLQCHYTINMVASGVLCITNVAPNLVAYSSIIGGTFNGPLPQLYNPSMAGTPSWSLLGNLPPGLHMDTNTGQIIGTVAAYNGGVYNTDPYDPSSNPGGNAFYFLYHVSINGNTLNSAQYTMTVNPPPYVITGDGMTISSAYAFVGQSIGVSNFILARETSPSTIYTNGVFEFPGSPTFSYSLNGGVLPFGMTIDPFTGNVTGTSREVGTFVFSIKATDNFGSSVATGNLTLHVLRYSYPTWPFSFICDQTYVIPALIEGTWGSVSYSLLYGLTTMTNLLGGGSGSTMSIDPSNGTVTIILSSADVKSLQHVGSLPKSTLVGPLAAVSNYIQLHAPTYNESDGNGNLAPLECVPLLPNIYISVPGNFTYSSSPYYEPQNQNMVVKGNMTYVNPPFVFTITQASVAQDTTPGHYNGIYVDPSYYETVDAVTFRGGLLTGSPTNAGTFTFTVSCTDATGFVVVSSQVEVIVSDSPIDITGIPTCIISEIRYLK